MRWIKCGLCFWKRHVLYIRCTESLVFNIVWKQTNPKVDSAALNYVIKFYPWQQKLGQNIVTRFLFGCATWFNLPPPSCHFVDLFTIQAPISWKRLHHPPSYNKNNFLWTSWFISNFPSWLKRRVQVTLNHPLVISLSRVHASNFYLPFSVF